MLDRSFTSFLRVSEHDISSINTDPHVGIELEYEGYNHVEESHNLTSWYIASDGSLRNRGVEFISHPVRFQDTDIALDEIERIIELSECTSTDRCGLHVHVNMRPYTIGQAWSFLTLYALVEPTIFDTFAEGRLENIFAVPLMHNTAQLAAIIADINALRTARRLPMCSMRHTSKYSALNVGGCAMTFGTFEMRQPYCSNNFDAIRSWIDFVKRLHTLGVSFDDPLEVLDRYEREGLESFQEELFGTTYFVDPDNQELADDAAYFAAGYNEPDWETLEWEAPTMEVV